MTAGELGVKGGIRSPRSNDIIKLDTYKDIDNIGLTAAHLRMKYVIDNIDSDRVIYEDFDVSENGMISILDTDNRGSYVICNKSMATAVKRRDDQTLRFIDAVDGHIATLHGMLKLLFFTKPPTDTVLGHAHNIFTSLLYSMIIRMFNKDYSLIRLPEKHLACIRYACACISASKHFLLDIDNINDVCVPITTMTFNRVNPEFYKTDNNIKTYESFVGYIAEKGGLHNLEKSTLINGILRMLGYRALITLECGADMLIDCLLSKSINHILSHNLFKLLGPVQHDNLNRKILQLYMQQLTMM